MTTSAGTEVTCGAVVVTGGIGTFTPRPLPAGEEFLGRGLEYFVPDPAEYAGQDVVVVGGGDSALDWCLMLEPVARQRDARAPPRGRSARTPRASSRSAASASRSSPTPRSPRSRAASGSRRRSSTVKGRGDLADAARATQVVAALGFTANLGPLREWGLELHDNRHLVVDSAMRTNLPGVFAAGDITDYDGKVRLIAVGFGEVATAVNNAAVHIDPDAQLFPGHSTDTASPAPRPRP